MNKIISLLLFVFCMASAEAASYVYYFRNASLSEALVKVAEDHPDLRLNFIYNELDKFRVSTRIDTDDFQSVLKHLIGLNPVSVINDGDCYFIEARKRGRYCYSGKIIGTDNNPVEGATVMLLAPKDSTFITYGVTDAAGRFSIPCDRRGVIGKISCVGHNTLFRRFDSSAAGNIVLPEIVVALDEVKVKGETGILYSDRSVYIPTLRQRTASNNAYDLLRRMVIPQVNVSGFDDGITDNSGKEVRIFIDGIPARNEELNGMRTSDVRKVEYLENPVDARFQGAARVINFIMQKYEYGGYTKLSLQEGFLTGLDNKAEVYSAFSYRKMHYSLYSGSNNSKTHLGGTECHETYELKDGEYRPIYRNELLGKYTTKEDRYPVTFRATYNTEKVQVLNTVSFSKVSSQTSEGGEVSIDAPDHIVNSSYSKNTPGGSNNFTYTGYQFYSLPHGISISLQPDFRYSRIHDRYSYTVDNAYVSDRKATEDAYKVRLEGYANKKIRTRHTLSMFLWANGSFNRLRYDGDVRYNDRFSDINLSFGMQYNLSLNNLYFNLDGGVSRSSSKINAKRINETRGFTHLNLQYAVNTKNRLSLNFTLATGVPQISMRSSDILQMNELLYITGNPDLRRSPKLWADFDYDLLFSDKLWMSAFGSYEGSFNNFIIDYTPYEDGRAVIRRLLNNGGFHKETLGMKFRVNLLDGKLMFQMRPQMSFYRISGLYNRKMASPDFNADFFYYLGNFYFQAYYQLRNRSLNSLWNSVFQTRDYYSILAGWSNGMWNVRLSCMNLFNRGSVMYENNGQGQYYSTEMTAYGSTYCPKIGLSASYTIGYGKKIERNNEIGERGGAASAIIK